MKRLYTALLTALILITPGFSAEIESTTFNNLMAGISRSREPVVSGRYIVFTASGTSRHAGIAFEYENYRNIHSFQRLVRKNEKNEKQKTADTVLFYISEIPPGLNEIRYRMVIDGLWTTDPMNQDSVYDYGNGMNISIVPVEYYEVFQTQNVNRGQVRFTYTGESGKTIRLAGTFNNWDPFMYEMAETSPGKYELILPLPAGKWYYAYFEGSTQLTDNTNREQVYTKDGRVASVVTVE